MNYIDLFLATSLLNEDMLKAIESGKWQYTYEQGDSDASIVSSNSKIRKPKDKKGIYLVNIRVLNRENNILQYSYTYYPQTYRKSIITYLEFRKVDFNFKD